MPTRVPAILAFLATLGPTVIVLSAVAIAATLVALVFRIIGAEGVPIFVASAVALAALASMVGDGTDQLGHRLGSGATGVLQSALGNLPELFISIFALQAGLTVVVQTALIGSILANALLVLGIAFLVGGLRHGEQHFASETPRMIAVLILLATAALAIPALATAPGAPDAGHAVELSVIASVVLLVVFVSSIPSSVRGGAGASSPVPQLETVWPIGLAVGLLTAAALGAALVSEWFVESLRPAMATLGLSQDFVGLVVVAIAGNAVEHVVGVQMAARNKPDLAVSLILNSALQVALALTPALVLLSLVIGPSPMTLVVQPVLIGALALSALLSALITVDGRSTWLEGLALIGLYIMIAAAVWWGTPVTP
jgi:Ca2+:H+ antiporter